MIRRRHCAVAHEDDVLQRQKARQAGMIAEGRALGRVGRAVASAARQHVKPHWQASIASSQGKQLQLLQPLPRWVVPRLQARPSFHGRLRRKQTRKSHGHGVRLETMQVELIVLGGIGDQIAPDDRPLVVEGVQRPTRLVIVHLPRPLDLGIQRRNGKAFGPTRQVIQGGWVTEPGLGDPFCHQAVIQLRLLSDRTTTMHNLLAPHTPQHRHGEHQRAHRPSLAFHLMQLYSHGSTSISTGNCMLPFYCSSNPMQEVRNTSRSLRAGDPDRAFREADGVVSARLVQPRLIPNPLEPRAVVASYERGTGNMTLWLSTQAPHLERSAVVDVLGFPENKLRVIAVDVGGGFGCKIDTYPETILAAHLSMQLARPVKWVEDRQEHFLCTSHGRGEVQYVEAAYLHDGTLSGLRLRYYTDLGAYCNGGSHAVVGMLTPSGATGVYRVRDVAWSTYGVYT